MGSPAVPDASNRRGFVVSSTKFVVPARPRAFVSRPSLLDRLDGGRSASITLVVGSPGAGKTCLLADWADRQPTGSTIWINADQSDNDPVRFWHGFLAAIAQIEPSIGDTARDLLTLDGVASADFLEAMLIADTELHRTICVIVDDFQLVGPEVAEHVRHLVRRRLTNIRLVLGTRNEPAIDLHRLRLEADLCEIREADLRLTPSDTAAVVAAVGVELEPEGLELLQRRTEGWAAGVQLAAVTLRTSDDASFVLRRLAGTTEVISQYLTAEMLDGQPDAVRQFLLDTCVVDQLTPELCKYLSSQDVTLPELEAANLLVTRLDADGTQFRYHHLFVETLRYRLTSRDPNHAQAQQARAADWFEARGDIATAVRHRWRSGQNGAALELLQERVIVEYLRGRPAYVSGLEAWLTDSDLRTAPSAAIAYGVALFIEGIDGPAAALLARIEAVAGDRLETGDRLRIAVAHCHLARQLGNAEGSIEYGERALREADAAQLSDEWSDTARTQLIRAYGWVGNFARAEEVAARGDVGDPDVRSVELPAAVAATRYEEGRLDAANESASVSLSATTTRVEGTEVSNLVLSPTVTLGLVLLERGNLIEAERELLMASVSDDPFRAHMVLCARLGLSRLWRAQGNFDSALTTLAKLRERWRSAPRGSATANRIECLEARMRLDLGDDITAESLVAPLPYGSEREILVALIDSARGFHEQASMRIDALQGEASFLRARIAVALAALHVACAMEHDEVEKYAGHVLDLTEPEGFLLAIGEAGAAALGAACDVARRRPRTPFIDGLLALPPLPIPAHLARPEFQIEALTPREQAVLRYLVTSMSYREIADDLFVSVNTVKTHVKNTIRKLGAETRTEAIERARSLHYL